MADIKARLLEAIGGFKVPQHKKEGLNEFEITEGKDGKMNVRDTDVHARLDAIEQKLNGTLEMQLTGRNVEEVTILPSTALSDTDSFSGPVVDISKYKSFLAFARNTHDVEVGFVITPGQVNSMYWDGANWSKRSSTNGLVTIPPSIPADLYNLTDFFAEYKRDGFKEIQVRGRASDVPTSGSIEVFIWGVPN